MRVRIQTCCGILLLAAFMLVSPWTLVSDLSQVWVYVSGPTKVGPTASAFGKALAHGVKEAALGTTELKHVARLDDAYSLIADTAFRRVELVQTRIESLGSRVTLEIIFKFDRGPSSGSPFSRD